MEKQEMERRSGDGERRGSRKTPRRLAVRDEPDCGAHGGLAPPTRTGPRGWNCYS